MREKPRPAGIPGRSRRRSARDPAARGRRRRQPVLTAFLAAAALTVPVRPARGVEAPRERTGSREPAAVSLLAELRPFPLDLPAGRALGVDLDLGLEYRAEGGFRCSVRLPLAVWIALGGAWSGRAGQAFGDPSVEMGTVFYRGGSFGSLGAGYSAPLGVPVPDPARPLRPAPGTGLHRVTVTAGWGTVRDPAALACGFSWSASFPRPDDPDPAWRPADLGLSLTLVEVLNDGVGILFGLSPRFRAPALGPGAVPGAGWSWDLEARLEVHLREGRLFLRAGTSRSLAYPQAPYAPVAGVEYEFRVGPAGGGG